MTISATFAGVTRTVALQVRSAVTAAAVTLNPGALIGGTAPATGTVTLSAAAPTGGATVALSSGNPPIASPAVPSVIVPAGTSAASFSITTRPANADTPVAISAAFGGVTRSASLLVQTAPLLKASRIRVLSGSTVRFDSNTDTGFLPGRAVEFLSRNEMQQAVILIDLVNAAVDPASVSAQSFVVSGTGPTQPWPLVVDPGLQQVRWSAPVGSASGRGPSGCAAISSARPAASASTASSTQFPTGNGVEGGDLVFTLTITEREIVLPDRINIRDLRLPGGGIL